MASTSRSRPLNKKEQLEEEIREKVKDSPFYYEDMSLEEMQEVEKALNEANDIEQASTSTTEFNRTRNTSDLPEYISTPSFSYKKEASKNLKYSQVQRDDNSSEYDLMSNTNNLNNENSNSDSKPMSNKNINFTMEDYPPLKNKSSVKSNKEQTQTRESNKIINQRRNVSDKWRTNPLISSVSENDVPLKQPERVNITNGESLPYSKSVDVDDETFEKLCQQMSEKLDSLHKRFTSYGVKKWGSPIKATGKWTESPDKTVPVEKPIPCNDESPEMSFRDTHERGSKRKALSIIHAACANNNSDENSESEFDTKKKRKCHQSKKEEGRRNQETQKRTSRASSIDTIDVSDLNDMQENLNTDASGITEVDEESTEYPRRIIPPNPSKKKNYRGPRGRKRNATQSQSSSLQKSLDDEEINKTLNEIAIEINDECIDITTEIKPVQVPKNISNKLSVACSSLQKAHVEELDKIKAAKEAKQQKEQEELKKKDELISRRKQQNEDKLQRIADQDKKFREGDALYRERMASKNQKVTRSSFLKVNDIEEDDTDDVIAVSDDTTTATTTCPICCKDFPNDEIETHASECDAFSSDEINIYQPSTSRSREMDYKCSICNNYTTCNGNNYSEHVTECKEKAELTKGMKFTLEYKV